ncbi:MAG: Stk1 family PASTA domain-containing Ser/Thr kinase [Actinobacteria bacterium]|nr:Stk1 family PASTA domain-containing Ser/Thr kinase [Actinomycetota bacterium]
MAQVGDVFANRYEIERELARGGMADVYLATDRQLRRKVAVKVLFPEFARDPSFVERFRREAQNAASLNHPNICAVYDWGQERGTYYIVMEYVEGRSLRDIIRAEGQVPAVAAARIAAELADALAFAHRRGVIHRDVKPGNVLITGTGQVKLTDFGIAANQFDASQGLTQTGAVMGTATYFSPEQAQGHPVDGRSDVYALGVVLYEMLTGVPPFSGESPVAVAMKHVREVPPPMTVRVPDVPTQLQAIVNAALTKEIEVRYQSAEEMRVDLVDFGRGRPLTFAYESGHTGEVPIEAAPPTVAAAVAQQVIPAPPTRRSTASIVLAVLGITAVVGVLVLISVIVVGVLIDADGGDKGDVPSVEVPSVIGQPFDQASATLTAAGFTVSRLDDELSTQTPGTVLAQDPTGGRLADQGSAITLTVAGAEVTIPDVTGQTYEQAAAAIQRLQLIAARNNVESTDKAPGTVLGSNPAAKTKVPKGSTVTLDVAAQPGVDVPDVTGKSEADAIATMRFVSLVPTVVQFPDDTIPVGNVIATNPAAGTRVEKGSPVTVIVSSGPAEVDVPNVTGQTTQAATAALFGAGFNVIVQQSTGNPPGIVYAQNPTGGKLPRGGTVTIFAGV